MSMYDITEEVLIPKAKSFIPVGIHKVKLVGAEFKISKNNRPFFVYSYEDAQGRKGSKTEWPVNIPANFATLDENTKNKYKAIVTTQKERIAKVAAMFLPKDQLMGKFPDFESLARFYEAKLKTVNHKDVWLRVKFTYDKDGWITTPTYNYNEWIERADKVKDEASLIEIIEGKDIMTRPAPKKSEEDAKRESSPLKEDHVISDGMDMSPESETTAVASSTAVIDDLPF